jgi:hypothetical protein
MLAILKAQVFVQTFNFRYTGGEKYGWEKEVCGLFLHGQNQRVDLLQIC